MEIILKPPLAANWCRAGADGIFFWNLGTPFEYKTGQELLTIRNRYYATLSELGEAKAIKGKDKLFCVDGPVLNYYQHISSQRSLPVQLTQRCVQQVAFEVGDDVQSADKQGRLSQLTLSLRFRGPALEGDLHLLLNGEPLPAGEVVVQNAETLEINYRLPVVQVKLGRNVLEAKLLESLSATRKSVKLDSVKLWVRYEH